MQRIIEAVLFIFLLIGLPILATLFVDYIVNFVTMETIIKGVVCFTVLYGVYTIRL